MSNENLQYFCQQLAKLDSLSDAVIVEEYTSPVMPRPVLRKMASVGIKSVSTTPVSRVSFRMTVQLEVRLLFPCGMGDNAIGTATDEIITAFSGTTIYDYYVSSINCGETKFDSTAYAIRSNIVFNLENLREKSNGNSGVKGTASIGELKFHMLPHSISILRPDFKEETDEAGNVTRTILPREYTLKGHSLETPQSDFFKNLNALTETTDAVELTLPYSDSVEVRCRQLEIEYDGVGYGFDYSIVLIEKM